LRVERYTFSVAVCSVGLGWAVNGLLEVPTMLAFARLNRRWSEGRLTSQALLLGYGLLDRSIAGFALAGLVSAGGAIAAV